MVVGGWEKVETRVVVLVLTQSTEDNIVAVRDVTAHADTRVVPYRWDVYRLQFDITQ